MLMIRRQVRPARPTDQMVQLSDKTTYCVFDDGSWRREPKKLRGKAAVKTAKRARRT